MKRRNHSAFAIAALAFTAAALAPSDGALAQKSKDTLRIALTNPIDALSSYYSPGAETAFESRAIFDTLVVYDKKALKHVPLLAKSWKRVSPTTLEFELRDDVTWHDGEKFDADDVVHTFSWLTAKKTKLRFKGRWAWIKSVEKLGPHRLRIIAKRPTAFDIARLGYQSDIFPEHIHGRMKVQSDFARKPVGTGMVKVTDVGQNRGITWVKNRNYVHESPAKPSSNIGRVKLLPIPDSGSQIARLLVGEVDVVRGLQMNQIDDLTKDGRFERHVEQGLSYIYLALDAKGRAGQKALTDARVRKALMLAVDRQTLTRMVIGDAKIPLVEALCWRLQSGCDYTKKPPARDPAAARKLLAAAGYAKGFDVEITTFSSPYMKQVAVALTDQFRRLGVRATVAAMPISAYRRKHRQGKIQILVGGWPAGAMADVSSTLGFFYRKGSRDFHGDKELQTLARKANSVMDEGKRRAIGRKIFDATTERAYFMPLSPSPGIFVHSKKVDISGSVFFSYGIAMGNINWK